MFLIEFIKKNKLPVLIVFTIAVLIIIFVYKTEPEKKVVVQTPEIKNVYDYSSLSSVIAKSYLVYDIAQNKVLLSKDEHLKLPLASVTKLMSALVITKGLPDSTLIVIDKESLSKEGDSGLFVGEKWKLKNLLNFTLLTSSNDGIHALASVLDAYGSISNKSTVEIMNDEAKNLLLNDTTFLNETGLDIDENLSGAYSSSYDIAKLLSYIMKSKPDLIIETSDENKIFISENNFSHYAKNTNISLNNIPGIIASKTGFTELAGGNLAIVFDAGIMHPVVVIVLGSTQNERFTDVETLTNLALQKLSE